MKRIIFLLLSTLTAVACVKQDEPCLMNPDAPPEEEIVLQPRDPSLPTSPNRELRSVATRAVDSGFTKLEDFIGRSYNDITSILGDQENILYPVIDLERLRADHPSYFKKSGLFKSKMNSYAYASNEEFERKSSTTEKISTGFRVNLGFFSIGRKTVMERTFSTEFSESSRDAFGELNVYVQNAVYSMMTSTLSNKRIAAEYLDRDFIEHLYNLTIDELLSVYGTFVLTGYYTGGRASAFYYGHQYKNSDYWARVEGLQTSMEASCVFNKTDTLGFGFGFSNNNTEAERTKKMFESVQMSVKTIGGTASIAMGAKTIADVNLDLSSWLASLGNPSTHAVIGLEDGGLHPVSDFLLEENFRVRISEEHNNNIKTTRQQLPFIEITTLKEFEGSLQSELVTILNTRHGDKIILGLAPEMFPGFERLTPQQMINAIILQKEDFFKLEIRRNLLGYTIPPSNGTKDWLYFRIDRFKEPFMKKFINENNNMMYLLDTERKLALSFPNDDYTIDVYGIREWVEAMPVEKLNILDLCNNYRVFGL